MTILLLGAGPRVAWVRSLLETLCSPNEGAFELDAEIFVVEGLPTRELLISLADRPIDILILVDHGPFANGAIPEAAALAEVLRGEAQRAVFALELARRATRTLRLSGNAEDWINVLAVSLASRFTVELGSCPPAAGLSSPVAMALVRTYLEPLFAAAGRPLPIRLAWPREAFLDGDAPGETLLATVEVAGRARILAYGPYLPLPTGYWQATAFLGFSPDIGRLPFILEADTGDAVTRGFFEVERGGIFTLELDFQVTDALHCVELRLISQDSAIEGQLALIEVDLKQSPPPATAPPQ